jgi:transposase
LRIEAHAALLLGLLEQKADITLAEIQAELARAGVTVGIGTIWRFFDRHRITRKKRQRMPPNRTVRTS